MQKSSQFQARGKFAWEHLPVHVVQELKPGLVIRTAESDRPRVKDPHEQDPVARTRDLPRDGAIGGATMRFYNKKRGSYVFTDSQTHVPEGTEIVMIFAFEIQRESNPRGSKSPSHTVLSTNRVYTIGTECSHCI